MMEFEFVLKILAAFERENVAYALVGSMAMAAQGLVRATRDLDVFVSPDPANVERLKTALKSVINDPSIDEISAADLGGSYPAVCYAPPEGDWSIDFLARLGDAFRYEDIETEELLIEGVRVRVATPRMLYRMKKDTVRPQDRVDADALRLHFQIEDE